MAHHTSCPVGFPALVCTLVMTAIITAGGCGGGPEQKSPDLAGTWKNVGRPASQPADRDTSRTIDDTWASLVLTLGADGKFQSTQTTLGAPMTMAGTWSVRDHALTLAVEQTGGAVKLPDNASPVGKTFELAVNDDGTRLTLRRPSSGAEFTYERSR